MKNLLRGEVWLVDLGLAAKVRPCLVISVPLQDEDRALVTIIPHTTSLNHTRFEVSVSTRYLKAGAFDAQQLVSIPRARFMRKLGRLDEQQLARVELSLRQWLGLEDETDSSTSSPAPSTVPPPDAARQ